MLSHLLVAAGGAPVHSGLPCWRELLQLAAELHVDLSDTAASLLGPAELGPLPSASANSGHKTTTGGTKTSPLTPSTGASSSGTAAFAAAIVNKKRVANTSALSATTLMPGVFQSFRRQMDGIFPSSSSSVAAALSNMSSADAVVVGAGGYTPKNNNNKSVAGGRKNSQQDAVEFLTFLLDALHEEVLRAEAHLAANPPPPSPPSPPSSSPPPSPPPLQRAMSVEGDSNPNVYTTGSNGDGGALLQRIGSGAMSTDSTDATAATTATAAGNAIINQNKNSFEDAETAAANAAANGATVIAETVNNDDDGWNTVSSGKSAKGRTKVKAVVVDAVSKERAATASSATIISRLFHATLR